MGNLEGSWGDLIRSSVLSARLPPPASRLGLVWAPFRSVFSGCDSDPFFSPSRAAGLELRAEAFAMAPHWAVWLLAVGLWGLGIGAEMWWNLVPRKTVSSGGECLVFRRKTNVGRGGQEGLVG